MRRRLVPLLLMLSACPEDDEPSEPPRCTECDNAMICPERQPSLNPLQRCEEDGAVCFYCGELRLRYVCEPIEGGELAWQNRGEADMCPPPPEPMPDTD